ncbi:MAG: DMT family transporter [Verrucomicrobiota bacterium]
MIHPITFHSLPRKGFLDPQTSGYLVLYGVVVIWAGFALTLRAIGSSPLAPADVALMRFCVPVIALLPFLPSRLARLRQLHVRDALMVLCGGIPFFFIATEGARTTSAAHVGALIAGTAPLSVGIIGYFLERRRIPRKQIFPLALIVAGAIGTIASQQSMLAPGGLRGVGFLIVASILWGIYTIGLRRAGMDAIGNALFLAIISLVVLIALIITGATPSHLGGFTLHQALPFILIQGLGVGLLATLGYAFAITRLGTSKSATIGSLAPALASLLAIPVLGEQLGPGIAASIIVITAGVLLANRSTS